MYVVVDWYGVSPPPIFTARNTRDRYAEPSFGNRAGFLTRVTTVTANYPNAGANIGTVDGPIFTLVHDMSGPSSRKSLVNHGGVLMTLPLGRVLR